MCYLMLTMNRSNINLLSYSVFQIIYGVHHLRRLTNANSLNQENNKIQGDNRPSNSSNVFNFIKSKSDPAPILKSSRVLINVITSGNYLPTLSTNAGSTWASKANLLHPILFFIGDNVETPIIEMNESMQGRVIQLQNVNDERTSSYNIIPTEKAFAQIQYVYDNYGNDFDWFIFMESDTFFNQERLDKVLTAAEQRQPKDGYIGLSRDYTTHEKKSSFCLGFGFLMRKDVLQAVAQNLIDCQTSYIRRHYSQYDMAVGYCVKLSTDMDCQSSVLSSAFIQRQYGSLELEIPYSPPSADLRALFLHPVSSTYEMKNIHDLTTRYLNQIINLKYLNKLQRDSKQWNYYQIAIKDYKNSCVANSAIQLSLTFKYIPECSPPLRELPIPSFDDFYIPTYVLNLKDTIDAFKRTEWAYMAHNWKVNRFIATDGSGGRFDHLKSKLTFGEIGCRDSYRRIFEMALEQDMPMIIVIEDDTFPSKHFKEELYALATDSLCGDHLYTNQRGGTVLLGSTVYGDGTYPIKDNRQLGFYAGWNLIDDEVRNNTIKYGQVPKCYNIHKRVRGTFGAIYHRNVYKEILQWLKIEPNYPIDWMWEYLGIKGYIGKIAHPNIVMPDTSHQSTVDSHRKPISMDRRNIMHRWDMSRYDGFEEDYEHITKKEVKQSPLKWVNTDFRELFFDEN